MKNKYYSAAGMLCLLIALVHTVGGQLELVNPLLDATLDVQVKTEWLGVWHLVTVLLWYFGFVLLKNGRRVHVGDAGLLSSIGRLSMLFALVFIAVGLWAHCHAPQYIFFLPVAVLVFLGNRKEG